MSALRRLLSALAHGWKLVFQSDLTLRRDGGRLRVALADASHSPGAAAAAPSDGGDPAVTRERQQLQLMRDELRELLDELPGTREECRNLAFFESALERGGLRALEDLPLDVLQSALQQFEGLVTNWAPEGLARLRSKMAVAATARRKALEQSLKKEGAAAVVNSATSAARASTPTEPARLS